MYIYNNGFLAENFAPKSVINIYIYIMIVSLKKIKLNKFKKGFSQFLKIPSTPYCRTSIRAKQVSIFLVFASSV